MNTAPRLFRRLLTGVLTASLCFVSALQLRASCGNPDPDGPPSPPCEKDAVPDKPCACEDKSSNGGSGGPGGGTGPIRTPMGRPNFFKVSTRNVNRVVGDLEVWGGVGEHQLRFSRHGNSRLPGGLRWFGDGHGWRHSYQYDIADAGTDGQGRALIVINFPDGSTNTFTKVSATEWHAPIGIGRLIYQNGTSFTLRTSDGFSYAFQPLTGGIYQMLGFFDSQQNWYAFTYDSAGRLWRVTEPAGRYLELTYATISVNEAAWSTLAQAPSGSIPPASWSLLSVSNATSYRFLRYAGALFTHSQIAEMEFLEYGSNQKLSGIPFGSTPPDAAGREFGKASDGDTSTFFSYDADSFGFTGIDLGAGNTARVGSVRFFPPPNGGQDAMKNGRFQGSNVAPQLLTVISRVSASDGRAVDYDYSFLADQATPAIGFEVLSGARYGDGTAAAYTYAQSHAGERPLMVSANDPRYAGLAVNMRYTYDRTSGIIGALREEKSGVTGAVVVTVEDLPNSDDQHQRVTYANGSVQIFYNPNATPGRLATFTDGLNRTTTYTYPSPSGGFPSAVTDPLNHKTQYLARTYLGNLLSVKYADNSTESWTRDSLDRVLTHTDELGRVTTWTRDAQHRVTRVDYPDASYETWTYNTLSEPLTHRLRNGGSESFAYDTRGLQTSRTDAENHSTAYTYDANDRVATITDPLTHGTAFEYTERGLRTKTTYADNSFATTAYDAYGNATSRTNEIGKTWTSVYDEFRRQTSATDPLNRTTHYAYDLSVGSGGPSGCGSCSGGFGGPTTITLPSGKTTLVTYDVEWQRTSVTAGANTVEAATTNYGYDAAGNMNSLLDARGKNWTHTFDARNRRLSSTDPLNHPTSVTYDAGGNVLTETRADNGVTTYEYDTMHRRTKATDPLAQVTRWAYYPSGQLQTLTDARNNAYGFTYDLLDRKTAMTYPDASHENWSYDAVGNAGTYTTRAGQVKTFSYDVRNRQTLADWSDTTPDVSSTYDAAGRLLTLNNSISALTYTYDNGNQMLSETQDVTDGPGAQTLAYSYDADGRRATLTYPDGHVVTYGYTARNQLASVTADSPPPLANYVYDLTGNRTSKTLENGTSAVCAYDDVSRLTSITDRTGSTPFASFTYAYNAVNNRTSVTRETGLGDAYGYDATDQLTGVQYDATNPAGTPVSPAKTQAFAYDAVGNRTSACENASATAYSTNSLNEYTMVGGAAYASDANGNTTKGPTAGKVYRFDAMNRLIGVALGSRRTDDTMTFDYDGRSRCVRRTTENPIAVSLVTPRLCLIYDGWSLIEEQYRTDTNPAYTEQARYINGANIDEVLAKTNANGTVYYSQDALSSTTHLTNSNGAVVESYKYEAFGAPRVYGPTGSVLPGGTAYANRFLFTGREWLANIGAYDYRNRMYVITSGRFLQCDPMGFKAGDINLYRYVRNMVSLNTDPMGLKVWTCCRPIKGDSLGVNVATALNKRHCWIVTDTKSGEIGPGNPGPLPDNPQGIPIQINDASGEGGDGTHCTEQRCLDEACVNSKIQVGKSCGTWQTNNNCNTFIDEILDQCQKH